MEGVVAVRGFTKQYDDVLAVQDLDVTVQGGEIFGLIGPNGAGKTTVVRAITGTITPTAGEIAVFGAPPGDVASTRIGLLPQAFSPPSRLTGREIVEYYGGLYPTARATSEVLADVGMTGAADRWYERLSGGQRRRICIGTVLVHDPDLLILDEPTTGIDPRGRRRLWELLGQLRSAGKTIILTTHDMQEAATLADRVGLLSNGRLVEIGSPDELIAREAGENRLIIEPRSPRASTQLAEIPFPVEWQDEALVVSDVPPEAVTDVMMAIAEAGVDYTRVTWEKPSLEDVFIRLTEEEQAR